LETREGSLEEALPLLPIVVEVSQQAPKQHWAWAAAEQGRTRARTHSCGWAPVFPKNFSGIDPALGFGWAWTIERFQKLSGVVGLRVSNGWLRRVHWVED
jgi:hypothetical protein